MEELSPTDRLACGPKLLNILKYEDNKSLLEAAGIVNTKNLDLIALLLFLGAQRQP